METYYTFKAFKGDNCVHNNKYYKTQEQAEIALQAVLDFSVAGFDRGYVIEAYDLKELTKSTTQKVLTYGKHTIEPENKSKESFLDCPKETL